MLWSFTLHAENRLISDVLCYISVQCRNHRAGGSFFFFFIMATCSSQILQPQFFVKFAAAAASHPHCIAFVRGRRETAENLCRYIRLFPLRLDLCNRYFDYEKQTFRVRPPAQWFDAPASTRLSGHPSKY